jgi:hypothetical protein
MDMMKRLIMYYDGLPKEEEQPVQIDKPKRGRPAKK